MDLGMVLCVTFASSKDKERMQLCVNADQGA